MKKRKHLTAVLAMALVLAMVLSPAASAKVTFEELVGTGAMISYRGSSGNMEYYQAGSGKKLMFRISSSQAADAIEIEGGTEGEDYELSVSDNREAQPAVAARRSISEYQGTSTGINVGNNKRVVAIEFKNEGTYTLVAKAGGNTLASLEMTIEN